MQKIPTLFLRDPDTNHKHVLDEVNPDCQWVIDGEGVATYKWDGTSVLIDENYQPWKRREVKKGKTAPPDFREETFDETTGKRTGWVPLSRDDPGDRWHFEALADYLTPVGSAELEPGTYELVGPKVQGNPHRFLSHNLIRHGDRSVTGAPRSFVELATWLHPHPNLPPHDTGFEGVVWHHPDGRMAKIKAKDFPS